MTPDELAALRALAKEDQPEGVRTVSATLAVKIVDGEIDRVRAEVEQNEIARLKAELDEARRERDALLERADVAAWPFCERCLIRWDVRRYQLCPTCVMDTANDAERQRAEKAEAERKDLIEQTYRLGDELAREKLRAQAAEDALTAANEKALRRYVAEYLVELDAARKVVAVARCVALDHEDVPLDEALAAYDAVKKGEGS